MSDATDTFLSLIDKHVSDPRAREALLRMHSDALAATEACHAAHVDSENWLASARRCANHYRLALEVIAEEAEERTRFLAREGAHQGWTAALSYLHSIAQFARKQAASEPERESPLAAATVSAAGKIDPVDDALATEPVAPDPALRGHPPGCTSGAGGGCCGLCPAPDPEPDVFVDEQTMAAIFAVATPAPSPSGPTTRDVPPNGLRCLSCEVRPATRYARDENGMGFALCDSCRLEEETDPPTLAPAAHGESATGERCALCSLDPAAPEYRGRELYRCDRCGRLVCSDCSDNAADNCLLCSECPAPAPAAPDYFRRSMEEGMSGPEALAYLDGAEEHGATDLRTRIVEHLEAAGLTKARLIVEGLWDAAAPSAPTTREADVPPAGLRCLSCEVRPATRYARDAEGFGFALCDRCRMDDEAPASAPPAPSPSPADREESAGGACPVPKCHAGMLRDHNGHDSVSCPVCDGTLTMEDLLAASPADAKEGTP
jgi:hypothetical protein